MHLIPKHWYRRRIRLPSFLVNIHTSQQTTSKESPMLSRANSDGCRLRRAKSSSSTHQRALELPGVVIDPRHAGHAAVEAYQRAHQDPRPLPRRRSGRSSQGSHFDQNRRRSIREKKSFVTPIKAPAPESLRSKVKRLLSRPKQLGEAQSRFPAQHVEARNCHFDVYKTNDDSFSAGPEFGVSLPTSPFSSLGPSSAARSRDTSWSNSATSNRAPGRRLPSIEEAAPLPPLTSTPEPSGSFIGRALRFPLRRPSRISLHRKSEESKHLYDALLKRIDGPDGSELSAGPPTILIDEADLHHPVSAQEDSSPVSPATRTIRAVTPEASDVIPESPTRPAPVPPHQATRKSSWWSIAPSLRSKKRRPSGPVAPSKEQIALRIERSENRWQAALENGPSVVSRALDYCIKGDNPYELRPLESPNDTSLPVAIRHDTAVAVAAPTLDNGVDPHDTRQHVVSPSIYSRSATPDAGMFITITGREVKRYPLESPPRPVNGPSTYAPKPSNEWRAWFSKEIEDFSTMPAREDSGLTGRDYFQNNGLRESKESLTDPPAIQAAKTRPELRSRASSIMNERYPMIETGRPLSRASGRRTNPSSANSSGQRTASGSGISVADNVSSKRAPSIDDSDQSTPVVRSTLRERQSASTLVRKKSSLAIRAARHDHGPCFEGIDSAGRDGSVRAPKSAADLRATYRNNRGLEASNLNIRRKPIVPAPFDDHTLRRISEGPYAGEARDSVHKENTAPIIDGMTIPPFYTNSSPPKWKESSPGQRMVDDFLSSRKVIASPPAFI